MNIDEIRRMIRSSIKAQVNRIVEQRRRLPRNFAEFNSIIQEVSEDIDHETLYDLWENISSDVEGIDNRNAQRLEWNDSLEYYLSRSNLKPAVRNALMERLTR